MGTAVRRVLVLVAGVLAAAVAGGYLLPTSAQAGAAAVGAASAAPIPAPAEVPLAAAAPVAVAEHPDWAPLAAGIGRLAGSARVGVVVIELEGAAPSGFALQGEDRFDAASTYKLVALMAEADAIAAGRRTPASLLCYREQVHEPGWFEDYAPGACLPLAEVALRAGRYSDNTAGHMLVQDLGGSAALNAFARAHGASGSELFEGNTTTAHDLAVLWAAEARGELGGEAARAWLDPILTTTRYEAGVPAGIGAGPIVIHKTGELGAVVNDAALVRGAAGRTFVLVVLTDGAREGAGWELIASISRLVGDYESRR